MLVPNIRIGLNVKASRDIFLNKSNLHVTVLSAASGPVLKKGTAAEITAVSPTHIDLNCKDGPGHGIGAWGLKIRITKVTFGNSFE